MAGETSTKKLALETEDDAERRAHVAAETIPEGGLEGMRRREAERRAHVAEERIPEGGLAGLKAKRDLRSGEPLVKAVGLTKSFLGTMALCDMSVSLYPGEIFGLVGPNGAGKTTLLRILATLTRPDSGEATICGYNLTQLKEVRAVIGFMPDVLGVYDDMLVAEYLEFFARASGLPPEVRNFAIEESLNRVGLEHVAEQPVDGLSRGMKQRLALGRAILHKPKLLLLDEPASGLDPLARLELRNILRELQRQGATVVISSHVLEDLADMCDRVAVIAKGRLVKVEETSRLIRNEGSRRVRARAYQEKEKLFAFLQERGEVSGLRWDNESLVFQMEGAQEKEMAELLQAIVTAGIPLVDFSEQEASLESAYMNLTQAGEGWEAKI